MALQGYSARILACRERIDAINRQLKTNKHVQRNGDIGEAGSNYAASQRQLPLLVQPKRKLSAKAKRGIARGQKLRWAKFHAERKAETARQKQILAQAKKKPQRATASATA